MPSRWGILLMAFFTSALLKTAATTETQRGFVGRRTAPHVNIKDIMNDGSVTKQGFDHHWDSHHMFDERNVHTSTSRVPVATVAWFTLAMAVATGLGAVPFFFVELEPQWAGLCNGLAAGVMLAASFDLVREGQEDDGGCWVVTGILAGGLFIWLCKKFLEQYGEISMLDVKGADASKVILVVGIMTLHSFGEGSGVGVSFAGSKGLSQGLLVTLAIAVHNIPEGLAVSMVLSSRGVSPQNAMLWSIITSLPQPLVAVPAFLCADTFQKVLPFCTGFAAGCMIWMVIAEVLPDAFKEAAPSHVASSATIAVAFMETLGAVLQGFSHGNGSWDVSAYVLSLLFALGPLLGGIALILFALALRLQHAVLSGIASGIAFLLAAWRPLQLLLYMKMGFPTVVFLLAAGATFFHVTTSSILKLKHHRKVSTNGLSTPISGISLSALTLQSFFACGAISLHALAEGLALGVAAPQAYGLGRHMVLPVSLHGLPRGAAVASCIFGATDSWRTALTAATLTGFAGPVAAIGALLAGIDNNGLDYWMVFACGTLLPSFGSVLRRAVRLDLAKSLCGFMMGLVFASVCLVSTKMVCLHTPYCNSAPEAVR